MRNRLLPIIMFVIALLSFGVVAAQDATATPAPEGENVEILNTLEDITNDSTAYYGQQVTVEGVIEEFLNARTFVLGEGATLDDDKVLVINTSGQELPLTLSRDQRVRLVGTIYPSIDNGGFDQINNGMSMSNNTMTNEAMATEDMAMVGTQTTDADLSATATAANEAVLPEGAITAEPSAEVMGSDLLTETPMMDDSMMTATPSMNNMNAMGNPIDFSTMLLPDGYANYTILVLSDLQNTVTLIMEQ